VNADVVVLGGEAAVFDEKLLSRCHLLGDDVAPRFWDSGAFIVMSDPEAYMSCASRLSVSR
jgi:hypothetical protein